MGGGERGGDGRLCLAWDMTHAVTDGADEDYRDKDIWIPAGRRSSCSH